jgi:hypothetical protein
MSFSEGDRRVAGHHSEFSRPCRHVGHCDNGQDAGTARTIARGGEVSRPATYRRGTGIRGQLCVFGP